MMALYEIMTSGRPGQGAKFFYVDGVRVPYAKYEALRDAALRYGGIEILWREQINGMERKHCIFRIPETK